VATKYVAGQAGHAGELLHHLRLQSFIADVRQDSASLAEAASNIPHVTVQSLARRSAKAAGTVDVEFAFQMPAGLPAEYIGEQLGWKVMACFNGEGSTCSASEPIGVLASMDNLTAENLSFGGSGRSSFVANAHVRNNGPAPTPPFDTEVRLVRRVHDTDSSGKPLLHDGTSNRFRSSRAGSSRTPASSSTTGPCPWMPTGIACSATERRWRSSNILNHDKGPAPHVIPSADIDEVLEVEQR